MSNERIERGDARVEAGAMALAMDHYGGWDAQSVLSKERLRNDARAVLAAADAAQGWQPIETAPKDEEVLLFGRLNERPFLGYWSDYERINQPRITHWMPLPAAPQEPTHD